MSEQNVAKKRASLFEIFLVSTRLGLTSFGGPTAHLGYFHEEYVRRRKWMNENNYSDLIALSQFLPGPASSQVGIGVGVMRAGVLGGIVSFIGFTAPSVIVLMIFALFLSGNEVHTAGWMHGLHIVAVAVIAHAIIGMAKTLTPNRSTKTIALFALIGTLSWKSSFSQISVILLAAIIGLFLYKSTSEQDKERASFPISKRVSIICLSAFVGLLVLLPVIREVTGSYWIAFFESFYRSGSFVFGGGHVVLPLLEQQFVATGWMVEEVFLAGYGAAQAVPGPLFTFASYLGAAMNGWVGGVVATIAIFLPAFLLIVGILPFWDNVRNQPKIRGAVIGVNAAVVGILMSALYFPVWTSSILSTTDFALAALLFSMLAFWKCPPWIVVASGAIGGMLMTVL